MGKAGRKSKYHTHIEPYFKEISEMLQTMTEEQIAEKMGVGVTSWCKYKNEYPKFAKLLIKGRQELVNELKSVLIKRAKGFQYQEKKVTECSDGNKKIETITKSALPDVASINLLLKNYDKDNWSNDPQLIEIKKQELELKKLQAEAENW